ncbi:TraB/GumN family protein [Chitinophaga tropicalis]|uniref:TraB/GumN family protein n=1 Tax=Chitinophaga tropicalis TaxID=2683588 RepID=A0A7K1U4H1_9BACT|nr:TraB/GumN family protein [Chitinophaga tropicalis]MVT09240.1 TraB/GumN family protein [Chitinophaga tropicalis]
MLRKTTCFLLFLCSFFSIGQAQSVKKTSLLWEVSGNGLQQSSWLYGTIHITCPEDLQFSAATQSALKHSKQLFLEIDLEAPDAMAQMQQNMMLPEGQSFKSLLPEADYALLATWFKDSVHVDIAQLDRFKPIVAVSLLSRYLLGGTCAQITSVEAALTKLAKESGLTVNGLETIPEQMALFDSIPNTEQATSLVKTLKERDKSREMMQQLIVAYRKGDVQALHDLISSTPEMENYTDLLLYNRNRKWVPILNEQMQKGPAFIAVGGGHLGGTNGVIDLLRKEGYTVNPR